jgi:hypothetical protein
MRDNANGHRWSELAWPVSKATFDTPAMPALQLDPFSAR